MVTEEEDKVKEAMKETRDRYFQKVELRNLVKDFEPT